MDEMKHQLEEALREATEKKERTSVLRRRLRHARIALRRAAAENRPQDELTGSAWRQWLGDNQSVLEGAFSQALGDLRGFSKNDNRYMMLYGGMEAVFASGKTALTQDQVLSVLRRVNEFQELGETQFDFLRPAIQTVLLLTAAVACDEETLSETIRERLLSYAVTGLAAMNAIDFDAVTREVSVTERVLLEDPAEAYPKMDKVSRRHYRHVAGRLAQRCDIAESQVAKDVLACAQKGNSLRERHVGLYLLNHDPLRLRAARGGLVLAALCILLPILLSLGVYIWQDSVTAALLSLVPLTELCRSLLCPLFLRRSAPTHLPRMSAEALEENRPGMAVAVVTLLPSQERAGELRTRLEQLYFANKSEKTLFCLIADYAEDRKPWRPADDGKLAAARAMVESLNEQYGLHFALWVRRRVWCATQGRYCGHERKRGAILEFIRFASGEETGANCFVGDRKRLESLRYLMVLDSDTGLSLNGADSLLAAAIHPLNRPESDETGKVVVGHGILCPRVEPVLTDGHSPAFAWLMGGFGGHSAYAQECGELTQDLYGETLFTGKGLFDMEAFQKAMFRRLPENAVLSHDILEGAFLRAGFVSAAEVTEQTPGNATAWFGRLHRWIRGDWQNIRFLGKSYKADGIRRENAIGWRGRLFLLENLRRSLVPFSLVICLLAAAFSSAKMSQYYIILVSLTILWKPVLELLSALYHTAVAPHRFFSQRFSPLTAAALRLVAQPVMLAQQTAVGLDAIGRALWRVIVSKQHLLEWQTAAQAERERLTLWKTLRHSLFSILIGLILTFFSLRFFPRIFGVCFLLYPAGVLWSARIPESGNRSGAPPSGEERERILDWCARMLGYYERYADKKNHWLPPDNMQLSPVEALARRTSPTNIGMMLLAYLAARDLKLLDSAALSVRVTRTLDTLEKLETYQGNLYNWYATDDLRVLPAPFVSSVDSGNYLCALTALREGLREYSAEEPKLRRCIDRIGVLLEQTDFSIFYDKNERLLTIGIDENGKPSRSHYDFLMSEARTASYYAIATRQAPPEHWGALNTAMSRSGTRCGPVSWTGTMFEYYMPHLLLPVYERTILFEGLSFAYFCQRRRAARAGTPWGISESCYLAFDDNLIYQYKAHGVQQVGVKRGLDRECVVSPYSSFLALPYHLKEAMENLERMEKLGAMGLYGFYEALDFSPRRAGPTTGGCGMVYAFMAHHIGMSMVACANALLDNVMQKRFLRDPAMGAARELLRVKPPAEGVIFDHMKQEHRKEPRAKAKMITAEHSRPCPGDPACTILAGGNLAHLFTDSGAGWLRWGDTDITRRPEDLLLHPQGIFAVIRCGGETVTPTAAPFYPAKSEHTCTFGGDHVAYKAKGNCFTVTQTFSLDRALPVERCELTLESGGEGKLLAEVLLYLEPVLSRHSEYAAHPAFSKLFLTGGRDASTNTLTFARRHRDGGDGIFLTVGFQEECSYVYTLKREEATPYPEGMNRLLQPDAISMEGGTATPDGCCAIRLVTALPERGQSKVTLLLSCGVSKEESIDALVSARARAKGARPAPSVLQNDSMTARLGSRLLPTLFFTPPFAGAQQEAVLENTRGRDALWTLGLSGDEPIVIYDWAETPDRATLEAYLRFWRLMRLHRFSFDLCVWGLPEGEVLPHGVHRIDKAGDPALLCALRAEARAIVGGGSVSAAPSSQPELQGPKSTSRPAENPEMSPERVCFTPADIFSVEAAELPASEDRFDVVGGVYEGGRFYVQRVTPLPFSHILANPSCGCLLQDSTLGYTWWNNARECRLTPWKNDIASGDDGEKLLIMAEDRVYDLCRGALASFSPEDARYEGGFCGLRTTVEVRMDPAASIKYLDVTIENTRGDALELICAYGIEPVLGVTRGSARHIRFEQYHGCLLLHTPWQRELPCHMAIHAPGEHPTYMTDRKAFLAGNWKAGELLPNPDPLAATLVRKRILPKHKEKIRFILAAAENREKVLELASTPQALDRRFAPSREIRLDTPSEPLNRFFNTFAPHQVRAGRLLGRTGFYQSSGAYGFRDQLQDAGNYLYFDATPAKEQILRCCAAQFWEGDVLHWWHDLPKAVRGIRTRFSDDLLWLPFTVCDYLDHTKDTALLKEEVFYCAGALLEEGEQERYMEVQRDERSATVYGHCVAAIRRANTRGAHGIPLIGCGDWNDGFSKVGIQGTGESVWLAMFLILVLERFAPVADFMEDKAFADQCRADASNLRQAVEGGCWDGKWYLRAFFDDGSPMGSHGSSECRIDLLPQAFSVLCGMADESRIKSALDAAMRYLVDYEHGIIKLFTPPFDKEGSDPGYIRAYPTGIRENGGQYTHGALWLAAALLRAGRTEEGWALLDMMNPTARCTDLKMGLAMKTEPYYMAADIYTHSGCYGHGGWSIYTGAAGWYCRVILGELLGLRISGGALTISPKIPKKWNRFSFRLREGTAWIEVVCVRTGKPGLLVDGQPAEAVLLDGVSHKVEVMY